MAKFVEDEDVKVQDTLIDFGELGKWSKETLKAHAEHLPLGRVVGGSPYLTPFEQMYKDNLNDYDNQLHELSTWKVGFRTELREISWRLAKREELFKQRDELNSNFQKYINLFPDRRNHVIKKSGVIV